MEIRPRILVADDHPLFRAGVIEYLRSGNYEIAGEAEDGEETLRLAKSLVPDILILDLDMPKFNGIQVIEQAAGMLPKMKIIFLTMYKEEKIFNKVMDLGVSGYLLKECTVIEIHDCIEAVMKGEYFISPVLSSFIMKRSKAKQVLESENKGLAALTETERKILKLTAQSLTSKQIAEELFISPRTVDKHREHICTKLNIHGSLHLVKFAIENKDSL